MMLTMSVKDVRVQLVWTRQMLMLNMMQLTRVTDDDEDDAGGRQANMRLVRMMLTVMRTLIPMLLMLAPMLVRMPNQTRLPKLMSVDAESDAAQRVDYVAS